MTFRCSWTSLETFRFYDEYDYESRGGGDSHMKGAGVPVGKFELNS